MSNLRVHCAVLALEQSFVNPDFCAILIRDASRLILLELLVILDWKLIDINLKTICKLSGKP